MTTEKTTALVTGASSGIGAQYCRALASECDVIITTGRNRDQLNELAVELKDRVEVHTLVADLASVEGITRCIELLRQKGPVDYLINNAGFSTLGPFGHLELAEQQAMVDVHISATLSLCRAAIPFMQERGRGWIINVSSLASFRPIASAAVYCASKAFLNIYSEALQEELLGDGIKVQCLCPGFTRSGFHARESMRGFDTRMIPEEQWMSAQEVVAESLAALRGNQVIVVPGEANLKTAQQALRAQFESLQG